MSDDERPSPPPADGDSENEHEDDGRDSDRDSDLLSEIDEDQFEDYDPETAKIEDRPVTIDENVARTLKVGRRKAGTAAPKKHREARREKKKRSREDGGGDDGAAASGDGEGGGDADVARPRKARKAASGARDAPSPHGDDNEEELSPEERRRRALNRMMDEAARGGKVKRARKKDEIDLEDEIDDKLADLKLRMERACEADNRAREQGQPGVQKIKLLPEVVNMLNSNNIRHAVLDPDINFLQHVKFFLEPLADAKLPAFSIQRDVLTALLHMSIPKETLISSGIGKVVLLYTKSRQPEPAIKRMAERLVQEWMRPILNRSADYKKRHVVTRDFNHEAAKSAQRAATGSQLALAQRPAQSARERLLAPTVQSNRARVTDMPASYTVAPQSTFSGTPEPGHRPIGAAGMDAFRKMTQKGKKRN